jgi:serine/threonine protein kinase
VDRFEVQRRVDTPAGVRYDAIDQETGHPARLQRIPESGTPYVLYEKAFTAVQAILPSVHHPHLAQVIELGIDSDGAYAASSKLEGEPLSLWLLREGVFNTEEMISVATDCLTALASLNEAGLMHGDPSASKILVNRDQNNRLSAILIEPTIAFLVHSATQEIPGTPLAYRDVAFTSPELLRREPVTLRSDLYCLGSTLYYSITGNLSASGNTTEEIINSHLTGSPRLMSDFRNDIHPQIMQWVMSMIALDPAARPATATEALLSLNAAVAMARSTVQVETSPPLRNRLKVTPMNLATFPAMPAAPILYSHAYSIKNTSLAVKKNNALPIIFSIIGAIIVAILTFSIIAHSSKKETPITAVSPPTSPPTVTTEPTLSPTATVQLAKYVRIENRNLLQLSLAEVRVFCAGKNVARNGKATQSSVSSNGQAIRAIDGKTDGHFFNNSVTHTIGKEALAWWEVELPSPSQIDAVEIWNRTDIKPEPSIPSRLKGFELVILDAKRNEIYRCAPNKTPLPSVRLTIPMMKK